MDGGITHDFFKQSIFVKFSKTDPPTKARHSLDIGGTEHRGRVQVGQDHEADVVPMMQDEGFEREVNRREKGKKNQDYRGPKNGPREQALI